LCHARFSDCVAHPAYEKNGHVPFAWMCTRDERVEPFDSVDETVLLEEMQRTVGNRRLRRKPCLPQQVEDRVGPKGAVFSQEQFKNLSANRGQAQSFVFAVLLGGS